MNMFEVIGLVIAVELGVIIFVLLNIKAVLSAFYERVHNHLFYDKKLSKEDMEIVMDKYHDKKK